MSSPEDLEQIRQYIGVLKNLKASDDEKRQVADKVGYLVYGDEENQLAFEAEGGLPPLVQLLREGGNFLEDGGRLGVAHLGRGQRPGGRSHRGLWWVESFGGLGQFR